MAKNQQVSNVVLRVKRPEDLPRVVEQIHTLAKRLAAGGSVNIHITTDQAVAEAADTSADEAALL